MRHSISRSPYQAEDVGAALSPGAGAVSLCGAGFVAHAESAAIKIRANNLQDNFISVPSARCIYGRPPITRASNSRKALLVRPAPLQRKCHDLCRDTHRRGRMNSSASSLLPFNVETHGQPLSRSPVPVMEPVLKIFRGCVAIKPAGQVRECECGRPSFQWGIPSLTSALSPLHVGFPWRSPIVGSNDSLVRGSSQLSCHTNPSLNRRLLSAVLALP